MMATPQGGNMALDRWAEQQRAAAEARPADEKTLAAVKDPRTRYVVLHTMVGHRLQSDVCTAQELGVCGVPSNPTPPEDVESNLLRLIGLGAIRPLADHEHAIADANGSTLPGVRYIGAVRPAQAGSIREDLNAQARAYVRLAEQQAAVARQEQERLDREKASASLLVQLAGTLAKAPQAPPEANDATPPTGP